MHLPTDPLIWHIAISLFFGVLGFFISRKTKIAAIVYLIIMGIILGPSVLGVLNPQELGSSLRSIVFLGIAIILFEGGLTLDYSGYKKGVKPITYLLSLGVLVTWFCNALFIYYLFDFSFLFSLFASSLIIVTGPTVITPILRRINIGKKLFNILHWEGIVIDPIGVFLALLCFEIIVTQGSSPELAISSLLFRFGVGVSVGALSGYISLLCIRKKLIPNEMLNAFTLAVAILTFFICDTLSSESGLLGVIVSGFFIGFKKDQVTDGIKQSQLEITEILIGVVFILLAANLNLSNLNLFGANGVVLLCLIIFVTRPLSVFLSTWGSDLKIREKLFLAWISPRGIVVASMASLFYISLKENPDFTNEAWFVETFTFSVIIVTVLFQGLSAGFVARILKLNQNIGKEWVIVGIHPLSIALGNYLKKSGEEVLFIDNNYLQVTAYSKQGYKCYHLNALSPKVFEDKRFFSTSNLIALTDNQELNALICQHWKVLIAKNNLYRWHAGSNNENARDLIGATIWSNLEKPLTISQELVKQEKAILSLSKEEIKKEIKNKKEPGTLLAFVKGEKVFFNSNAESLKSFLESNEKQDDFESVLILRDEFNNLENLILPDEIVFFKKKVSFPGLVDSALDKIKEAKDMGPVLSEQLKASMLEKIKGDSIYLGSGIASINIFNEKVEQKHYLLFKLEEAIPYKTYDKEKIKVVFIIVDSLKNSFMQIRLLNEISKIINSPSKKEELIKTKSKEDVLKFFRGLH